MKKILYALFVGMFMGFYACEPIDDRNELGDIISPDQLDIVVHSIDGTNKIVMENLTPQYGGMWDYKFGTTTKMTDTAIVPVVGTYELTYYATSDGGIVTKNASVTIDEMIYHVPGYSELTGDGKGKVWVYDTSEDIYSYLGPADPAKWKSKWWNPKPQDFINAELTFSLDGANTVYKLSNEGTEELGSFLLDTHNNKLTILNAHIPNWDYSGDDSGVYTISVLTENSLVLYQKRVNAGGGWFWRFVPKEPDGAE